MAESAFEGRRVRARGAALATPMLLAPPAKGAVADAIPIGTAEQLLELLTQTDPGETAPRDYVLTGDIAIDTSELETSYAGHAGRQARTFAGTLDGGGHTVTLATQGDKPLRPLFDHVGGTPDDRAAIKNLDIDVQGDIAGSTLCASFANVDVTGVHVAFADDILPATDAAAGTRPTMAIATGLAGVHANSNELASFDDVSVEGTGAIGSTDPAPAGRVISAGLYAETNMASVRINCTDATVNVGAIQAASADEAPYGTIVVAAGAVGGYQQRNTVIANTRVDVARGIHARGTDGFSGDVEAIGLAREVYGLYNCHVSVGAEGITANVDAPGNGTGAQNAIACGLARGVWTHNTAQTPGLDAETLAAQGTGGCTVTVAGDISASLANGNDPAASRSAAYALGSCYQTETSLTWKGTAIKANAISAAAPAGGSAYAAGYHWTNWLQQEQTSTFGHEGARVTANSITATADKGDSGAFGFAGLATGTYKDCAVDADTIAARGADATAAGFAYKFSPWTVDYMVDPATGVIAIDGCTVSAKDLSAASTVEDANAANEALCGAFLITTAGLGDGYPIVPAEVRGNTARIERPLQASGPVARTSALLADNASSYPVTGNTVDMPYDESLMATSEELEGVEPEAALFAFTQGEAKGRARASLADESSWEGGNRVRLTGAPEGTIRADVFCRLDDANGKGTWWQLANVEVEPAPKPDPEPQPKPDPTPTPGPETGTDPSQRPKPDQGATKPDQGKPTGGQGVLPASGDARVMAAAATASLGVAALIIAADLSRRRA